ncbi:NUDIX hydrolase [Puniceibacterium sp. IMCC21224]|uniref:NUDIX hydrolase n=1 Tax=Puniceibacterium sp. IMCC21224 TaxID=1618204 RepID=UPI00064DF41B|nr:NUDIX hydrolase [Puniceibacterium sp. IMCC21224]KMK65298.1 ADP-ribose pyrophosphatase [Puniceibacterium sp. IMCC21224]
MTQSDGIFVGAKLMLFLGGSLLVIRRDHTPGITWPGYLDFPGGGREGDETAAECALRETREEVGLIVPEQALIWRHEAWRNGRRNWFFAAHQDAGRESEVVFGDEGDGWSLMPPGDFLTRNDAIPHFQDELRRYLEK